MVSKRVSLSRDDFSSSVSDSVRKLINDKDFSDVTLVCENNVQIKAHKVILSSSSTFFKSILTMNYHQHPLVYLKGVKQEQLKQIIQLIYLGEVRISESEVESFINLGKELEIDGLIDSTEKTDIETRETATPKIEVDSFVEERIDGELEEYSFEPEDVNAPPMQDGKEEKIVQIQGNLLVDVKKEKEYACDQCDYITLHSNNLRKHSSRHEGVRYQCEKCEKNY